MVLNACGLSSIQYHNEGEDNANRKEKGVWRVRLLPLVNSVLLISIIVPIMRLGI